MTALQSLAVVAAVAGRQHGAFSRAQAEECGVSDGTIARAVEAGAWRRRRPGVYTLASWPRTVEQRIWVVILAAGGPARARASRRTCVALHGVDGFRLGADGIDVCVIGRDRLPAIKAANLHLAAAVPDEHLTVVRGVPCTTLARALCDLPPVVTPRQLARAVDDSVLSRRVSIDRISGTLDGITTRGRPGAALLRQLLAARSENGYVPPESELEAQLVAQATAPTAGLPVPVLQAPPPWRDHQQQRVDVTWREARLIVECDGRRWHARMEAFAADRRRDRLALRHGYVIVRVTWEDVTLFAAELADDLATIYRNRVRGTG